jgi:hypothetical protein
VVDKFQVDNGVYKTSMSYEDYLDASLATAAAPK